MTDTAEPVVIGVMSDIHGNPIALEAVLDDASGVGVTSWLVLGDVVAMGPDPACVMERLATLDVVACIAGNTERYVLTGDGPEPSPADVADDPSLLPKLVEVTRSFAWTRGFLSAHHLLDRLRAFAPDHRFDLPDGSKVLAVHASAVADDGSGIHPGLRDDDVALMFPGDRADLVFGGHTHLATDRLLDRSRFVNPGSVSNPLDGETSARYVVLRCDIDGHDLEHRSVAYDLAEVRAAIRRSEIPGADFLLERYFG